MSDPAIKYKGTATRAQWRALFMKAEIVPPDHRAAQKWTASTCAQLFDVAKVTIKSGGVLTGRQFEAHEAHELVTLELSRDAVLGIKYAVIKALTGFGTVLPAGHLEREDLLNACRGIGPEEKLLHLIESEAKLPEMPDKADALELESKEVKI